MVKESQVILFVPSSNKLFLKLLCMLHTKSYKTKACCSFLRKDLLFWLESWRSGLMQDESLHRRWDESCWNSNGSRNPTKTKQVNVRPVFNNFSNKHALSTFYKKYLYVHTSVYICLCICASITYFYWWYWQCYKSCPKCTHLWNLMAKPWKEEIMYRTRVRLFGLIYLITSSDLGYFRWSLSILGYVLEPSLGLSKIFVILLKEILWSDFFLLLFGCQSQLTHWSLVHIHTDY